MDEAAGLIDAVHVGIEIASSPFPGINDLGPAVTISDFGNNNGLVVGAAIPDWRDRATSKAGRSRLPSTAPVVGTGNAVDMLDGPIGAARFLFELMARRGIALAARPVDLERRGHRRPHASGSATVSRHASPPALPWSAQ